MLRTAQGLERLGPLKQAVTQPPPSGRLPQAVQGEQLAIRRFLPCISNCVSILTPGSATQSLAACAFFADLEDVEPGC